MTTVRWWIGIQKNNGTHIHKNHSTLALRSSCRKTLICMCNKMWASSKFQIQNKNQINSSSQNCYNMMKNVFWRRWIFTYLPFQMKPTNFDANKNRHHCQLKLFKSQNATVSNSCNIIILNVSFLKVYTCPFGVLIFKCHCSLFRMQSIPSKSHLMQLNNANVVDICLRRHQHTISRASASILR